MLGRIHKGSLLSSASFLWRIKLSEEDPPEGQKGLFAQYKKFAAPYEISEMQFCSMSINLGALDMRKNSITDKLQGVMFM